MSQKLDKKSILEMSAGAIMERVDYEMGKVLDNIARRQTENHCYPGAYPQRGPEHHYRTDNGKEYPVPHGPGYHKPVYHGPSQHWRDGGSRAVAPGTRAIQHGWKRPGESENLELQAGLTAKNRKEKLPC